MLFSTTCIFLKVRDLLHRAMPLSSKISLGFSVVSTTLPSASCFLVVLATPSMVRFLSRLMPLVVASALMTWTVAPSAAS